MKNIPTLKEARRINELKLKIGGLHFMQSVVGVDKTNPEHSTDGIEELFLNCYAFAFGAYRFAQANRMISPDMEELIEIFDSINCR